MDENSSDDSPVIFKWHLVSDIEFVDRALASQDRLLNILLLTSSTPINNLHASGFLIQELEVPVVRDCGIAAEDPHGLLAAARST